MQRSEVSMLVTLFLSEISVNSILTQDGCSVISKTFVGPCPTPSNELSAATSTTSVSVLRLIHRLRRPQSLTEPTTSSITSDNPPSATSPPTLRRSIPPPQTHFGCHCYFCVSFACLNRIHSPYSLVNTNPEDSFWLSLLFLCFICLSQSYSFTVFLGHPHCQFPSSIKAGLSGFCLQACTVPPNICQSLHVIGQLSVRVVVSHFSSQSSFSSSIVSSPNCVALCFSCYALLD